MGERLLTGRQKPDQRQLAVDRFQSGETDLLLATFAAGGLGFTPTALSMLFCWSVPGLLVTSTRLRIDVTVLACMEA